MDAALFLLIAISAVSLNPILDVSAKEICTMTTDIPPDQPVWIEQDNIPGPTQGDTIIYPGDTVSQNAKVQMGYCKECVCEPGEPLICYFQPNLQTWISPEDPCIVESCLGKPFNKSASCKCPPGSDVILAPPEDCCGCSGVHLADTCSVDADDLSVYETAWTENNPDVQPGDELSPGEILHVGQCKECRCTSSGSLSCNEVKTPLPSDDPCIIVTCTPSYETSPFYVAESCVCKEDEILVDYLPAPVCCRCLPTKK